jgi:hypothetical protein
LTSGAGDGTETLVIRLCQRESASCGACCGVYNRRDFGRSAVRAELRRRTRSLSGLPRTPEAFQRAAAALAAEGPPPIFPSVHACPLFGYLDAAESRVGCLGHPAATGGIDLRDCGAYDSGTCDAFLCPSHAWLEEDEAALAEAACAGDSWLYGLVVTDPGYLRATLSAVADLAGSPIRLVDLDAPAFREAFRRLLAAKEELAPGSDGLFAAFRGARAGAADAPDPDPPRGPGPARPRDPALAASALLEAMGADPRSGNDADQLAEVLQARLEVCARALRPR